MAQDFQDGVDILLKGVMAGRGDARRVAGELWHWALWLDREMNALACACTLEELDEINKRGLEQYEEWRKWREGQSHRYEWLKARVPIAKR